MPPVPVVAPDLNKLAWTLRDGAKEFHLIAMPVKREILPHLEVDVWGFNGTMPGPVIEVNQGDRVRIIVENRLPEFTSIHWHSLEVPVSQDGVPGLVQDFIPPGEAFVYEFTLHQHGTFFYHAHVAMQEAMGMVGLFIVHPQEAYEPVVDQDFALVTQEFQILPNSVVPNSQGMEFNFLTFNGRCAPLTTPLVVKLGHRVRLRLVNFSTADHHPIHLHGHTWWVTGTEGGRIPEPGWIPGNNVLIGVAQARDVEFIANNPGDWIMHCHMFHHMMNHMVSMAGPMMRVPPDDPRARVPGFPQNMAGGMSMPMNGGMNMDDGMNMKGCDEMSIPEDDTRAARPPRIARHAPRLVPYQGPHHRGARLAGRPLRQGRLGRRAPASRIEHLRADTAAPQDELTNEPAAARDGTDIGGTGRSGTTGLSVKNVRRGASRTADKTLAGPRRSPWCGPGAADAEDGWSNCDRV